MRDAGAVFVDSQLVEGIFKCWARDFDLDGLHVCVASDRSSDASLNLFFQRCLPHILCRRLRPRLRWIRSEWNSAVVGSRILDLHSKHAKSYEKQLLHLHLAASVPVDVMPLCSGRPVIPLVRYPNQDELNTAVIDFVYPDLHHNSAQTFLNSKLPPAEEGFNHAELRNTQAGVRTRSGTVDSRNASRFFDKVITGAPRKFVPWNVSYQKGES